MPLEDVDKLAILGILLGIVYLATKPWRYVWGVRLIRPVLLFGGASCCFVVGLVEGTTWFLLASAMVILGLLEIGNQWEAKKRGWKSRETYEERVVAFDQYFRRIKEEWAVERAARNRQVKEGAEKQAGDTSVVS